MRKIEMMLGSTTREVSLSTINVSSVDGEEKLQVKVEESNGENCLRLTIYIIQR
jgi:hypothetical protein